MLSLLPTDVADAWPSIAMRMGEHETPTFSRFLLPSLRQELAQFPDWNDMLQSPNCEKIMARLNASVGKQQYSFD
jgi:hypothetical protein